MFEFLNMGHPWQPAGDRGNFAHYHTIQWASNWTTWTV